MKNSRYTVYEVQTETGQYQHIIPLPAKPNITSADTSEGIQHTVITMSPVTTYKTPRYTLTQSNHVSKPPTRLISSGLI